MNQIPGIVDVTTDLQITSPQILVEINRDKASASESAPVRSSARWETPMALARSPPFTRLPINIG